LEGLTEFYYVTAGFGKYGEKMWARATDLGDDLAGGLEKTFLKRQWGVFLIVNTNKCTNIQNTLSHIIR
jgi:hypothetical protein